MSDKTLFEKIIAREIPADIVFEDEQCIAFRDISPKAPTHILVIPRAHVPSLNQVESASLAGELLLMAAAVARAEGIAESGYRVINPQAPMHVLVCPKKPMPMLSDATPADNALLGHLLVTAAAVAPTSSPVMLTLSITAVQVLPVTSEPTHKPTR